MTNFSLIPIAHRTELARVFARTITNVVSIPRETFPPATPLSGINYIYTATGSQTIFPDIGNSVFDNNNRRLKYKPDQLLVYDNGVLQTKGTNYTATDGLRVVFGTARVAGHTIVIKTFDVLMYENPQDYYYVFMGRAAQWPNSDAVVAPVDTRQAETQVKRDILAMQRITPADTVFLVDRYNWTSGTVYTPYRDDVDLSAGGEGKNKNFYVMNSSYRIYKCLFRPSQSSVPTYGKSLNEPTSTETGPFTTTDKYIWQLIYEVPPSDQTKFLTNDFIPVRFYSTSQGFDRNGMVHRIDVSVAGAGYTGSAPSVTIMGDGYGATAHCTLTSNHVSSITVDTAGFGYTFAVAVFSGGNPTTPAQAVVILTGTDVPSAINQSVALYAQATAGSINYVEVVAGGSQYAGLTTLTIVGDGQNLNLTAHIDSGIVTRVDINDPGINYTFANVTFVGVSSGSGCVLKAVVGPQNGHGANVPKELYAKKVCVSVNIADTAGDFFTDNDFRQVGIIKNPKKYNLTNYFTDLTGNACYLITANTPSAFNIDDEIASDSGGIFTVVYKTGSTIYLLPSIDSLTVTSNLTNKTTGNPAALTLSALTKPEVSHRSGEIIYLRNLSTPVTRTSGQTEQIKVFFSF